MRMAPLMIIYYDSHNEAINTNTQNVKFNLKCVSLWYIDEALLKTFIACV